MRIKIASQQTTAFFLAAACKLVSPYSAFQALQKGRLAAFGTLPEQSRGAAAASDKLLRSERAGSMQA